ncbi:MAG: EamA family transporter [Chloroflexota bacterium]
MDHPAMPKRTSAIGLWAALLTVYVVWGSTYLGIAIAIETIPPFLMLAIRFAIAGAVLVGWEVLRGGRGFRLPSAREWRDSAIVGALLLGIGNGFVGLAEETVPSGIAAILIALIPAWFAIFGWLYFRDPLPRLVVAGIAIGLVGVVLLVWPFGSGANAFDLRGVLILLVAPLGWAHGSLFSARRATLPARPLMATGLQMLLGSAALAAEGTLTGELARFDVAAISAESLWALAYLTVIGSLVAFNAYAWLLRNAPLSLVSTYAYVNPVVAVALGSLVLAEPITPRTLVASAVIVAAVAMIVTARGRSARVSGEEPVARAPEPALASPRVFVRGASASANASGSTAPATGSATTSAGGGGGDGPRTLSPRPVPRP